MKVLRAAVLSIIMVVVLVSILSAEPVYTCTCEGLPKYFLFFRIGTSGCGNGFQGGDPGDVRENIAGSDLFKYIAPSNIPAVKAGSTVHDKISGWMCRTKGD